jgi:hypothetical protein
MTHALVQGPSLVVVGKYFKKYRGLATTLANVGASSGILLFPLIFRAVLETYGLEGALLIQSGILLNFFVAGSLMRPLSFYEKSSRRRLQSSKKQECVEAEQMEMLLQNQNGGVENEELRVTTNKDSCYEKLNHNSREHLKENAGKALDCEYLGPVKRERTFSDSLKKRPVHLKPEISHSTKSLNRVVDHAPAVNGNLVVASSTCDIVGSVYSVCSLSRDRENPLEVSNGNIDADPGNKKSQSNCTKIFLEIIGFLALKIRIFQMWMLVAFFGILGNAQIAVYIPPLAVEKGISKSQSVLLLPLMGACDLAGKFILAIMTRFNIISKDMMMTIAQWILSVAFMCVPLLSDFTGLAVFAGILGSCAGVYFALFPAVLADYVGLTSFSDAMGLTMLVHGLSLTIGNPILGL